MHTSPRDDLRGARGLLSGIVEAYPDVFVEFVNEAVASNDGHKVATMMNVLTKVRRAPEVDWTQLVARWDGEPGVHDSILRAMVRHGSEADVAYVERLVEGGSNVGSRALTEVLSSRWEQDGVFEAKLGSSRKACKSAVPTPLDIWMLGLWGNKEDSRVLARLLTGSRSSVLIGRPLLAAIIPEAVATSGDRLYKANPIGSPEERERFLALDELGQMAILLSIQGRGLVLFEDAWKLGSRGDLPKRVRLVARAVYAGALGTGSHRPRYFGVLAHELGIRGGEEELHRRMREALESVLKEPDVPLFAKYRLWQGIREYRDTLDIDVLPEFKNPLAPGKPAQSMEPDAILPPPEEEHF